MGQLRFSWELRRLTLTRAFAVELGGIEPPSIGRTPNLLRPFPTSRTDAVPTGGSVGHVTLRLGGPRSVFPGCQPSFRPSVVFPTVIACFCCRAAGDRPRVALLLTMTLHSPEDQAARVNCSVLAILVCAPFSESEQLGSHARPPSPTSKPVSPVWRCDVGSVPDDVIGRAVCLRRRGRVPVSVTFRLAFHGQVAVEALPRCSPR